MSESSRRERSQRFCCHWAHEGRLPSEIADGLIRRIFGKAEEEVGPISREADGGEWIVRLIEACDRIGKKESKLRPNQLGRCRGDWFELAMDGYLSRFLGSDKFHSYPGRGHSIGEIAGFEGLLGFRCLMLSFLGPNGQGR
jgi:hypothetical protein